MTEDTRVEPGPPAPDALPRPVVEQRRFKESLIWLVPALAALVGLSLVIHNWLQTGPQVVISLQSAEGLDAGKTPVKYKNVVIGRVKKIRLSPDRSHVLVSVALEKSAEGFATKGTRYYSRWSWLRRRGIFAAALFSTIMRQITDKAVVALLGCLLAAATPWIAPSWRLGRVLLFAGMIGFAAGAAFALALVGVLQ